MSKTYSDKGYNIIADDIVKILRTEDILRKDRTVMDIGCGPGTYAFRISPLVKEVTCIDSSWPMLGRVKSESADRHADNISVTLCDCKGIPDDLICDVAFSSLCPPMNDPKMILSMERHAREWCVYVSSAKTGPGIETEIWKELGCDYSYGGYMTSYPDSFLKSVGRKTSLVFLEQRNTETIPLEDCISTFRRKISRFRPITEREEQAIRTVVSRHADGDTVILDSNSRMGLLYWRPNVTL